MAARAPFRCALHGLVCARSLLAGSRMESIARSLERLSAMCLLVQMDQPASSGLCTCFDEDRLEVDFFGDF